MTKADIQLWSIDITPDSHKSKELSSLLSRDELKKAEKFRIDEHRNRWITGRAMLRTILAGVTRQSPESLAFEYNEHAKPRLRSSSDHDALHFNLSHSADLALLAVTTAGPIGIDVEHVKTLPNIDAIVDRFFSAAERHEFSSICGNDARLAAFYTCWTRKEAYLKALGCGISKPTDTFDVTLLADSEPKIVAIGGDQEAARDWLLFDLQVTPAYVGALAIRTTDKVDLIWRTAPGAAAIHSAESR